MGQGAGPRDLGPHPPTIDDRAGEGTAGAIRHLGERAARRTLASDTTVHERTGTLSAARLSRRERVTLKVERFLDRWLSPLGVWVMRRTRGRLAGVWHVEALVLTTRGRRTGRQRTVVLRYFPDGDAMILAAANDGGRTHPAWYHNLVAQPHARAEVLGRTVPVRAEILSPDEARSWWGEIVRRQPSYERFALATTRTIPIVRLVPVT